MTTKSEINFLLRYSCLKLMILCPVSPKFPFDDHGQPSVQSVYIIKIMYKYLYKYIRLPVPYLRSYIFFIRDSFLHEDHRLFTSKVLFAVFFESNIQFLEKVKSSGQRRGEKQLCPDDFIFLEKLKIALKILS